MEAPRIEESTIIARHAKLRINVVHGSFLGSFGPILINLWRKT